MSKHVTLIASGETERRALPLLVRRLRDRGIVAEDVHLEAWYFADVENLRSCIGRAPGHVDTSMPDEIDNPKLQLQHLLGRVYTARVSAEIAGALDAATIEQRSPSFRAFIAAVLNGAADAPPAGTGSRRS